MIPVLCIVGYAGAGKDTVADRLVARHGFVKVSLADPLKRFCADVFEFSEEQLWGPSEMRNAPDPRYVRRARGSIGGQIGDWNATLDRYDVTPVPAADEYPTPRHALQQLGTEWGRSCCADIWIRYAWRVVEKLIKDEWVCYDRERGVVPASFSDLPIKGVVIPDVRFANEAAFFRSRGAKVVRIERPGVGAGGHASEQEQSEIEVDHVIQNDADLAKLGTAVDLMAFQMIRMRKEE